MNTSSTCTNPALVHYYPRALVGNGGATRAMWQWASALHAAGWDVSVAYDAALTGPSALRDEAVPICPINHVGAARVKVARDVAACVPQNAIVVLHSTYVPGNVAAAWQLRRRNIPYVVMPHGGYDARSRTRREYRKRLWAPLERGYLQHALAVHLSFEVEMGDARAIAPAARWIVAPTGADAAPAQWDGGSGGYVAWFGRFDIAHKGIDILVQAVQRLRTDDAHALSLRIHGRDSANSRRDVVALAAGLRTAIPVHVDGPVVGDAKADFLRRAAAYVHPSRWESHSHALIEALSSGVPSVVSAQCSIAPLLIQSDAAVVVEPTPEAIADGISRALARPRYYSERGALFARTVLSWPAVVSSYAQQLSACRSLPA
jgi:glycosyltransferase involved in cell wall biosynthesis